MAPLYKLRDVFFGSVYGENFNLIAFYPDAEGFVSGLEDFWLRGQGGGKGDQVRRNKMIHGSVFKANHAKLCTLIQKGDASDRRHGAQASWDRRG